VSGIGPGPPSGPSWATAPAGSARTGLAGRPPSVARRAGAGRARHLPLPGAIAASAEPVAPSGIGAYLIALLLIVATTVSVLAGGWIGGAQATVLVAVVAVVEAILLGRSGVGRLAAVGLAIPLCAAVVVPTTISLLPAAVTAHGFQHIVGEYILQAIAGLFASGGGDFVRWAFMVGLATVIWLCGFWLGWVGFREQRGVLAVLPALVVLAVNVLNAPSVTLHSGPGSSIGLAEVVALLAAILVVGIVQLGALSSGWRSRRVPTLQGLRARFTTAVTVTAIGVVAASLLIPPVTSTDISSDLFGGAGGGPGAGPGQGVSPVGFSTVVAPGGSLVNDPTNILTYYTDSGQDAYLQAVDDSVFSAGDWIPDFDTAVGQTVAPGAIPRDPVALGGSRTTATVHINFSSSSTAATGISGGSLGIYPGDPTSTSIAGTVVGAVVTSAPSPTPSPAPGYQCVGDLCPSGGSSPVFLSVDEVDLPPGKVDAYTTGGSVSTASVAQLEAAGTDYPSWVLPDATPLVAKGASAAEVAQAAAIAALAKQWTQGATTPYDQAAAIENHLRGAGWVYTLTPPATPAGQWSIVYFLQTSHQGYCQYFASAMGAMLRSLGIPTILLSGYGPGTATGKFTTAHQPIFQVTSTDAHSWVEAYFPGYGWVPFEPTPQSTYGGYLPFARGGSTPTPSAAPLPSRTPKPVKPTPLASGLPASAPPSGGTPYWLIGLPVGVVAVILVLLLGELLWWRRPRSLAGVWRRLALAARLSGLRWDEAETRADFAGRLAHALGGAGPPLLGTELSTVAEVSGKAEFSARGLEDADRRLWHEAWRALGPAVPRLLRRRLLRRRPAV